MRLPAHHPDDSGPTSLPSLQAIDPATGVIEGRGPDTICATDTPTRLWRDEADDAPRFPLHRRPTHEGELASGLAVVVATETRPTKTGGKYLLAKLRNSGGAFDARIWEDALPRWRGITAGTAVHLTAKGQKGYKTALLEWAVTDVAAVDRRNHPVTRETLPPCPGPTYDALLQRFERLRRLYLELDAGELLDVLVETPVRWADGVMEPALARLRRWPAALQMHHAHRHGLLWHSVQVAEGALALAGAYGKDEVLLDLDAIVLGALLHDIGKGDEQSEGASDGYPAPGRLVTHMGWGLVRLTEALTRAEAAGWTPTARQRALFDHLLHVVASHHGQVDWGALCPPVSREAWLVHFADNVSAKLEGVGEALRSGTVLEDGWVKPGGWRRDVYFVPPAAAIPNLLVYPDAYDRTKAAARAAAAPAMPDNAVPDVAAAPTGASSAAPAPVPTLPTGAPAESPRVLALRLPPVPAATPQRAPEDDDDWCPF